jgi:hypothetical protein
MVLILHGFQGFTWGGRSVKLASHLYRVPWLRIYNAFAFSFLTFGRVHAEFFYEKPNLFVSMVTKSFYC